MTMDTQAPALLPCPWCGKAPDRDDPRSYWVDEIGKWGAVQCCGIGPDVRTGYGPLEEWRDDAIAAWNNRVDLAALAEARQRIANLTDDLDQALAEAGRLQYECDALFDRAAQRLAINKELQAKIVELEAQLAALAEPSPMPQPLDWQAIAKNHHFLSASTLADGSPVLYFQRGEGSWGLLRLQAYEWLQSIVYALLHAEEEYGDTILPRKPQAQE